MTRIGVIGLGRMGAAMAQRMAAQGLEVTGWTRSGRSVAGVASAPDLDALVAGAEVLVLSLYDDAAVAQMLDALLERDLQGRLVVETSTCIPDHVRSRADAFATKGARIVDAPISGGPEMVAAGTCGVFIGGTEDAARDAEAALSTISSRIFHVGPLGAGLAMKTVNNAMLQAYMVGLAEVLPLAREAGLSLETALGIVAGGPAGTPMVKDRLPRALGQDDSVGFSLADVLKDNGVFRDVLAAAGLPSPILDRFASLGAEAVADGVGDRDVAAFIPHAYARP